MASCCCDTCVEACTRIPGWLAPDDVTKAIEAGYADRLVSAVTMDMTLVIVPVAYEDKQHLAYKEAGYRGRCTFLTADNRCELHNSGFKPYECRETMPCNRAPGVRKRMRKQWASEEGQAVWSRWQAARSL